jgi:arginase
MRVTNRPLAVLDAPSNLGLRPPAPGREPGVRRLAAALRAAGIVQQLGAEDAGELVPPPYVPDRDPTTGWRNRDAIARYSVALADRTAALIAGGRFPLVLGGDCSILVGNALALKRLGCYGLVYLDGHLDFRHPGNSPDVGTAAGEDLALVTGRGAPEIADLEGRGPYLRDADVVALGDRENDEQTNDILATEITVLNLAAVRRLGPTEAARFTLDTLAPRGLDGFWLHLDADVLDDAVMPAVDSPAPDGLSYGELIALLRPLLRSPLATGLEITIFDPDVDPDGAIAQSFTEAIVAAFDGA